MGLGGVQFLKVEVNKNDKTLIKTFTKLPRRIA